MKNIATTLWSGGVPPLYRVDMKYFLLGWYCSICMCAFIFVLGANYIDALRRLWCLSGCVITVTYNLCLRKHKKKQDNSEFVRLYYSWNSRRERLTPKFRAPFCFRMYVWKIWGYHGSECTMFWEQHLFVEKWYRRLSILRSVNFGTQLGTTL